MVQKVVINFFDCDELAAKVADRLKAIMIFGDVVTYHHPDNAYTLLASNMDRELTHLDVVDELVNTKPIFCAGVGGAELMAVHSYYSRQRRKGVRYFNIINSGMEAGKHVHLVEALDVFNSQNSLVLPYIEVSGSGEDAVEIVLEKASHLKKLAQAQANYNAENAAAM